MTHEEWAESERLRVQAATVAYEHAVVEGETAPAPPAGGDPLLAWLDAAPVTSSPAVALKVTAALRAVLEWHPQDEHGWCASLSHPRNFVPFEECPERAEIAETLGVTL